MLIISGRPTACKTRRVQIFLYTVEKSFRMGKLGFLGFILAAVTLLHDLVEKSFRMGKLGFLGFILAAVTLLHDLDVLSKWLSTCAYAMFMFFAAVRFALDLKLFFESPYPLRTKMIDVVLSAFLGDYFEDNQSWFNWKLNLYGNQFFAKETLFDQSEYPALYACSRSENTPPSFDQGRDFHPHPKFKFDPQKQSTWFITRSTGLDDDWDDTCVDLDTIGAEDVDKVCFRFYNLGTCHIKLKVQIKARDLYKCIVEVYRAGMAKKFAEQVEHFQDSGKVKLLFAYFQEFERSPLSGVVDVRKGGVKNVAKIVHCFRIADAIKFIQDNRCAIIKCQHGDNGVWIL